MLQGNILMTPLSCSSRDDSTARPQGPIMHLIGPCWLLWANRLTEKSGTIAKSSAKDCRYGNMKNDIKMSFWNRENPPTPSPLRERVGVREVKAMKHICPNCERWTEVQHIRTAEEITVKGEGIEVPVEYYRCKECDSEFEDPKSKHDPLALAFEEYRRRHAISSV